MNREKTFLTLIFFIVVLTLPDFSHCIIKTGDKSKIKQAKSSVKINRIKIFIKVTINRDRTHKTPKHNPFFLVISLYTKSKNLPPFIELKKIWINYKGELKLFSFDENRIYKTKTSINVKYILGPKYVKYVAVKFSHNGIKNYFLKTDRIDVKIKN